MLEFLVCVVVGFLVVVYHVQLLAFIFGMWALVTHLHLFVWVAQHPLRLLSYVASYFLVGAAWSLVKWYLIESERVRDLMREHLRTASALSWVDYRDNRRRTSYWPAGDFSVWIGFWPFSFVATFLDDPFRRMCQAIYRELLGVYKRISDHVWSRQ